MQAEKHLVRLLEYFIFIMSKQDIHTQKTHPVTAYSNTKYSSAQT